LRAQQAPAQGEEEEEEVQKESLPQEMVMRLLILLSEFEKERQEELRQMGVAGKRGAGKGG
jgi:hypothetical protein